MRIKYVFFVFVGYWAVWINQGCIAQQNPENESHLNGNSNEMVLDTIPEKNSSKMLDMNRHQLFLDTSRTSNYYERVEEWASTKVLPDYVPKMLIELSKDRSFTHIILQGFPTLFIQLNKLNGEFVLYDRCDGSDPIYYVSDSTLVIHGVHEDDVKIITATLERSDSIHKLQLYSYQSMEGKQNEWISIQKLPQSGLYKLGFSYEGGDYFEYATTPEYLRKFDVLVNHCPKVKAIEFDAFDP